MCKFVQFYIEGEKSVHFTLDFYVESIPRLTVSVILYLKKIYLYLKTKASIVFEKMLSIIILFYWFVIKLLFMILNN